MKQYIESGFVNGKFNKNLPFFMFAQTSRGEFWDDRKRDLKQRGVFNIKIDTKSHKIVNFRGLIFPVELCLNSEKKDFFLKFQRFIKKNRYNGNFLSSSNAYLKENGYDYLEINHTIGRFSYVTFKIKPQVYLEFLKDFLYPTKILDIYGKDIELLETEKFEFENYFQFLEKVYGLEKLLKYEIHPFELIYIYENVKDEKSISDIDSEINPLALSRYHLEEFFSLREDCKITSNYKFEFSLIEHGWIDLKCMFNDTVFIINCSDVFDPFYMIYQWLVLLEKDNRNHILEIDEEGRVIVFESFNFNKYLYLNIYYEWTEDFIVECLVEKDNFINSFQNSLKEFIHGEFSKYNHEYFWKGNIRILENILLVKNKEKTCNT